MAFKKLARQCLHTCNTDVDLDDFTVPERLTRIKDNVKHMLKTGDTSMYIQTHTELESLRACVLDDIITTPAKDLLLYTNCIKSKVSNFSREKLNSSLDLDTLVGEDLTHNMFAPRRAFSIPDLHLSYSVKEKKPKKTLKRFWNAIKKLFGKQKVKKYAGFSAVTERMTSSIRKPNIYDEIVDYQMLDLNLAYDVDNIGELLVSYEPDTVEVHENNNIMSSGDAGICYNEGPKVDEGNVPCQYDYTDLTESEAYDIAYGVQQVGVVQ